MKILLFRGNSSIFAVDMSSNHPKIPHPESPAESPETPGKGRESLDETVARVGHRLATTFQALLADLPDAPHRPQELARLLGINKDLSSRILKATESKDPIAIAHGMPGPDPLRRLVRAASRKGVQNENIHAAEEAVRSFELLIRNVAGDRGALDTIISAWLPEVREKAELLSKQAVFKGMSQIKGSSAEVDFHARFVHPAADGGRDFVLLSGMLGLRRLRPGAPVTINYLRMQPSAESGRLLTLEGEAIDSGHSVILEQFCSAPLPYFDVREQGTKTCMVLGGRDVGLQSAVDVTWAHVQKSCNIRGGFSTISTPIRKGIYDLFIHPDISPRIEPQLEIHDTMERGVAIFRDPDRALDRLDIKAGIDPLGTGAACFRCIEIPNYIDMIEHVCSRMHWDSSEFLGYRCAIDYPVYGSQVTMAFDPEAGS